MHIFRSLVAVFLLPANFHRGLCGKEKDHRRATLFSVRNDGTDHFENEKKLTKQALLAMYLNDIICEVDGYGPDGAILPLAISTTVQKDRFEAHGYISNYKDKDKRYSGSTVLLFKRGSKTATVTHVYRTSYNPANGRYKYHHKKKLSLKKGKTYYLRIYSLNFYCPGKFVVK